MNEQFASVSSSSRFYVERCFTTAVVMLYIPYALRFLLVSEVAGLICHRWYK